MSKNTIEGSWYFDAVGAPFKPHLAAFHDDGIVHVTFPDAAEANNSAGQGIGVWEKEEILYRLRFLENNADRATNQPTTTLIVDGMVSVDGDQFEGPAFANYYDMAGNLVDGPFPATLKGQRVTLDSGPPVMAT